MPPLRQAIRSLLKTPGFTIVALLTDRYFQDPLAVGKSMVITLCGALAIGMTLFLLGLRAYIRRQKELAA